MGHRDTGTSQRRDGGKKLHPRRRKFAVAYFHDAYFLQIRNWVTAAAALENQEKNGHVPFHNMLFGS